MLSDAKSKVIRSFRVLNTEVPPGDVPAYGVPFPAIFVTDESGNVAGRFIHRSYKIRSSPEHLIDHIRGEIHIDPTAPGAEAADEDVTIRTYFHGGRGTLRQGIERQVVVRLEPRDGLQIIAGSQPDGSDGTSVTVSGPPGLVTGDPILSTTADGVADIAIPVYAQAELISECRPIVNDSITIQVQVNVVLSDGSSLLSPKAETLELKVFLEPVDMPKLRFHGDTGQRRSDMDSEPHFRRLVLRQFRRHPLGAIRSIITMRNAQKESKERAGKDG